jgi:transposase
MTKGQNKIKCCQNEKQECEEAAMKSKYAVHLTAEERSRLNRQSTQGRTKVRQYKRMQVLLLADEKHGQGGKTDKEIAVQLGIGASTAERTRRRYVEQGLDAALSEQPRSGRPATVGGEVRAKITALACSTPPEGYGQWNLRLLADKAVELEFIEQISHATVREILKKTNSSRT